MSARETIQQWAEKHGKTLKPEKAKTNQADLTDAKIKELTIQMLTDFGYISTAEKTSFLKSALAGIASIFTGKNKDVTV